MALNVELRDGITGPVVDGVPWVNLPREAYDSGDQFPLASGIDPYSKTYFGEWQLERLTAEFRRLVEVADDPEQRASLARVAELSERGATQPHLYLVFVGD